MDRDLAQRNLRAGLIFVAIAVAILALAFVGAILYIRG